jgi:hypothetical protein
MKLTILVVSLFSCLLSIGCGGTTETTVPSQAPEVTQEMISQDEGDLETTE